MTGSRAFGSQAAQIPHLVTEGKGGVAGEVGDLRGDVERAFLAMESGATYPSILSVAGGGIINHDADVDIVITGTVLKQGQTAATLVSGTGNAALTFEALRPGVGGNDEAVVIEQGAGALSVAYADHVLTITLATGGSTATAVAAAVNADDDTEHVLKATAGGTGGSNVVVATHTHLSGGVGGGFLVYLGSTALEIKTNVVTDTAVTATIPSETYGVGAVAMLYVKSDGVRSNLFPLTFIE